MIFSRRCCPVNRPRRSLGADGGSCSSALNGSLGAVVAAKALRLSCVHSAKLIISTAEVAKVELAGWMGGGSSSGSSVTVGSEGRRPIDLQRT